MANLANLDGDGVAARGHDEAEPKPVSRWRRVIPVLVSVGMIVWLAWRFTLKSWTPALAHVEWHFIVPLTVALVGGLYVWDSLCVRWLFSQSGQPVGFGEMLRIRGTSYLAGALNYGLGQGVLAWLMARAQGIRLASALSLMVLLAYHDTAVLLGMALVSAVASGDGRLKTVRAICEIGLAVVAALALCVWLMPAKWRLHAKQSHWGAWLGTWSWRRSIGLCLLRLVNFGISLVYAVITLSVIGNHANVYALASAVPLVQLSEGLPISMSGLGPRESTLLLVLKPEHPEDVFVLGLIWSCGLIGGRALIGLTQLWLSSFCASPSRRRPSAKL